MKVETAWPSHSASASMAKGHVVDNAPLNPAAPIPYLGTLSLQLYIHKHSGRLHMNRDWEVLGFEFDGFE